MLKSCIAVTALVCSVAVLATASSSIRASAHRPPVRLGGVASEPTVTGSIDVNVGSTVSRGWQSDLARMREAKVLLTAVSPTPSSDPLRR